MNKKLLTSVVLILLFIVGTSIFIFLPLIFVNDHAERIRSEYSSWEVLTQYGSRTELCKFDLLKPELITVTNPEEDNARIQILFTRLQRDSMFHQEFYNNDEFGSYGSTVIGGISIDEFFNNITFNSCEDLKISGEINGYQSVYYPQYENQTRNNDLSESERELEEYNNFFDTLSKEEQLKELIRLYSELTPESEYWSYKAEYEYEISLRIEEQPQLLNTLSDDEKQIVDSFISNEPPQ